MSFLMDFVTRPPPRFALIVVASEQVPFRLLSSSSSYLKYERESEPLPQNALFTSRLVGHQGKHQMEFISDFGRTKAFLTIILAALVKFAQEQL